MNVRLTSSRAGPRVRIATLAMLVWGAAAGCIPFGAATLGAQTLPLLAQVQLVRERVFVGEWFAVRVRAVGSVRPNEPDVSAIRDFEVEYVGRADHASQRETIFQYLFRARRAGTLEIPPIGVSGAGAKTRTALARVEARLPENPGSFQLRVEPEQETAYVGQQIRVEFSFEADADAKNIHIDAPFLQDERFVAFLDRPPFRGRLPDGYQRVPVNRAVAIARIEPGVGKGRQILRFAAVAIPQRVGRIPLHSASVCATVPPAPGISTRTSPGTSAETPAGRKAVILSSPTGEIRDDREQRGFVYSEPSSLLVRELPADDVPPGFNGLVGRHAVSAEVSPPGITLGDPLELVVSLSGQPYLANATLPDLRSDRELLADFEVRRDNTFTSIEGGRKVFRYGLRPKRSGALVIPPIAYSYFDPGSGGYVSAQSAAVPVEVKENRVVTAADAEGSRLASLELAQPSPAATNSPGAGVADGGAASSAGRASSPVAAEPVTVAALVSATVRTLRSPLVFGSLLAVPLILLAAWVGSRIAKLRPWRVAQPAAPSPIDVFELEFDKQITGQLSEQPLDAKPHAGASAHAFVLFREYAGRRLRLSGTSMTFQDLAPQMRERGVDPRIIARVQNLFAAADASRFGAGSAGAAGIEPSEVRKLVREIEDELLRLKPTRPA